MSAEPKLFDEIEAEAEDRAREAAEKQRKFLSGFKFLQHDFVLEVTGKFQPPFRPLVYSPEFTNFTKELEGIRDRLQAEEIDVHAAFKEAVESESANGFVPGLSLGADGKIDASIHMEALKEEMNALKFYPSYPSHADNGELSSARSDLTYRKRRELEKADAYLTLKPLFAYAVDEDKLRSEISMYIRNAMSHHVGEDDLAAVAGFRRGAVNLSEVAGEAIEAIRGPLAKRGVIIRPKEAALS